MPSNFFSYAPQIISEVKYFDISREQIVRELLRSDFEIETEHQFVDDFSNQYSAVLRLNISCRSEHVRGWTVALKLHKERIDGIDWEPYFTDVEGTRRSG